MSHLKHTTIGTTIGTVIGLLVVGGLGYVFGKRNPAQATAGSNWGLNMVQRAGKAGAQAKDLGWYGPLSKHGAHGPQGGANILANANKEAAKRTQDAIDKQAAADKAQADADKAAADALAKQTAAAAKDAKAKQDKATKAKQDAAKAKQDAYNAQLRAAQERTKQQEQASKEQGQQQQQDQQQGGDQTQDVYQQPDGSYVDADGNPVDFGQGQAQAPLTASQMAIQNAFQLAQQAINPNAPAANATEDGGDMDNSSYGRSADDEDFGDDAAEVGGGEDYPSAGEFLAFGLRASK